jgi:hypothetical protein
MFLRRPEGKSSSVFLLLTEDMVVMSVLCTVDLVVVEGGGWRGEGVLDFGGEILIVPAACMRA